MTWNTFWEMIWNFLIKIATDRIADGYSTMEDAGTLIEKVLYVLSYFTTPLGIGILLCFAIWLNWKSKH